VSYDILLVTPPPSPYMRPRRGLAAYYYDAPDRYLVLHGKGEHAGTILMLDNAELDRLLFDAQEAAKQRPDYQPPIRSLLMGESKGSPQELEALSAALDQRFLRRHAERLMRETAIAGDVIAAFARAFA
jgi:hypothetical protein